MYNVTDHIVRMYIYKHAYVYIYIYICIYTSIYVYVYVYTHVHCTYEYHCIESTCVPTNKLFALRVTRRGYLDGKRTLDAHFDRWIWCENERWFFQTSGNQIVHKCSLNAPRKAPKLARRPHDGSRSATMVSMRLQDLPKDPQDGLKRFQDGSYGPQEGPRWPQKGPRWSQDGPKMAPRGLKRSQVAPPNGIR